MQMADECFPAETLHTKFLPDTADQSVLVVQTPCALCILRGVGALRPSPQSSPSPAADRESVIQGA